MKVRSLINSFMGVTELPVHTAQIKDKVCELAGLDEICIDEVDIDPQQLRGVFRRRMVRRPAPYADYIETANVIYASGLDTKWSRLVIVKELIHCLDEEGERTYTEEKIRELIDSGYGGFTDENGVSLVEREALAVALLVSMPGDAYDLIKEQYDAGVVGIKDISERSMIPEIYIEQLFEHGIYENILERFCPIDMGEDNEQ